MDRNHKIRVLVVDDSALARRILTKGLSKDPEIEIVGAASDAHTARDMIVVCNPDVITLDVEMPRMDGLEFLRRLMCQKPMPVLMVSSLTQAGGKITLEALEAGAVDFVTKPSANNTEGLTEMIIDLSKKVKMAAKANISAPPTTNRDFRPQMLRERPTFAQFADKVIAIGASTGGTEALCEVIPRFPASTPGVVIVQHMPPGFTKMFAERLNRQSVMTVKEANTGDQITPGSVLIAPGDYHMKVIRAGEGYQVTCEQSEKVNGHRPSVEVLFDSIAQNVRAKAVAAILTGMGSDGGHALARLRQVGGRTIAQDEETSVVFGMPKVAYQAGGAERLVPIGNMAQSILNLLAGKL